MSVFSFATPLSSSFNPPLVSRSRKKSIFFGGLEMDIFGWKRWKRGEEGSIWIFNWRVWDDFRSQEIGGRGRFDCSFFFFSFYAYKISNTNTKFSNKLIIQVQQIMQVTNSEFFFFFFWIWFWINLVVVRLRRFEGSEIKRERNLFHSMKYESFKLVLSIRLKQKLKFYNFFYFKF